MRFLNLKKKDIFETLFFLIPAEKIAPALLGFGAQLQTSLQADLQLFLDYKQRLLDIRQKQAASGGAENDADMDIEEADLLSDTTSLHSSRFSGSSRGTG